jgi:hypothetical protein
VIAPEAGELALGLLCAGLCLPVSAPPRERLVPTGGDPPGDYRVAEHRQRPVCHPDAQSGLSALRNGVNIASADGESSIDRMKRLAPAVVAN